MKIVKLFFDSHNQLVKDRISSLLLTLGNLFNVATGGNGTMLQIDVQEEISKFLYSFRRADQIFPSGALDKAENLLEALFGSNFRSAYIDREISSFQRDCRMENTDPLVILLNPTLEEDTKREGEVLCAYIETPDVGSTDTSSEQNPSTKIASITAEIIRLEGGSSQQLYMAANQIITRVFKA